MHEPPAKLAEAALLDALRNHYQLSVAELTFLPLGYDAAAWVYRVRTADDTLRFLKVRTAITNPAALVVPRALHDYGVTQVVAPIPTQTGALWAEAAGYALILYPFIVGASGMQQGMTPEQWQAYGATLRRIHAMPVPAELAHQLRREPFRAEGVEVVRTLDAQITERPFTDPTTEQLATVWRAQRATIYALLARAAPLEHRLAQAALPLVLCHADIHTNNILVDPNGQIWVVDWDETMLAPRERDLMFVVGGISARLVGPREEAWFFAGYGPITIDPIALEYYRVAWALSDIGAFATEVLLHPDLGVISRRAAAEAFTGLFAPGEIVTIAGAT